MSEVHLQEVDKLEVTVLIDNYTDVLLLQGTDVIRRPMTPAQNWPLAEHGLSCLLKVYRGTEEHVVLLDAGASPTCFLHNARVLNVDLGQVEAAILSHGHHDHFGALEEFFEEGSKGDTGYAPSRCFSSAGSNYSRSRTAGRNASPR